MIAHQWGGSHLQSHSQPLIFQFAVDIVHCRCCRRCYHSLPLPQPPLLPLPPPPLPPSPLLMQRQPINDWPPPLPPPPPLPTQKHRHQRPAATAAAAAAAAAAATATATAADVTTTSSTTGRRRCHRRRRSQHNDLVINDQPPLLPLPLPPRPLPLPLLRGLLPQQPPPGAGHGSEAAVTAGRTAVTFHLGLDQSAFFSRPPHPTLFTRLSLVLTLLPSYHK